MTDVTAFKYLDPKTGVIHYWPITEASSVFFRAKGLLHKRSAEEIVRLAEEANAIIDVFFDAEKSHLEQQLKADGRWDLFETDDEGRIGRIRDEAVDEYDVYNRETTSEFEALTLAMDQFFDPTLIEEVTDPEEYEIFAAVALCYLAQYIRDLKEKLVLRYPPVKIERVPRTKSEYEAKEIIGFASTVITAMEFLGHAQKLQDAQRAEKKFQDRLNQHLNQQSVTNNQLIEQIKHETLLSAREDQALERKRRSAENNQLRHQKNHAAKKLVLDDWEIHPKKFGTLEATGDHYETFLEGLGYKVTKRTVIKWLSKRASELGIPFGKR